MENRARWHAIGNLLQVGQYEQAAEHLRQAQAASERAGDATLAHLLDAARQICLACRQCQEEAAWHQQAHQEAGRQERALRQQLDHLLDLIGGQQQPEVPSDACIGTMPIREDRQPGAYAARARLSERSPPEPAARPGLWQRLQGLLRQRSDALIRPPPRASRLEVPIMPAHASTTQSATSPDLPSAPEREEGMALPAAQETQPLPSLAIYCLGPFRVYQNDQAIVEWDSLKGRSILKYMAAHRATSIVRDVLMDLFWPGADPEAARRNLHQAIYGLRQTLKQGRPDFQHIQFQEECYLLNPEMEIWVDVEEFEGHVQAARRLETSGRRAEAMAAYGIAESLYQGDFMAEDPYEDWPQAQREHMRTTYCGLADRLSAHYLQQEAYGAAIALCQKVLARDNCHEDAHRRLMQCYLAQGQRHLAVRQYQSCVAALREELDLAPAEETVALYRRIVAGA